MISVIGLGGPAGAGKDSLATALLEQGCEHFYAGGIVRVRAGEDGFVPENNTREAYVPFWRQIATQEGKDWLAKCALKVHIQLGKIVIFNGLRIPEDAEFIRSHGGVNIFMYCSPQELFRRINQRQRPEDLMINDENEYQSFHEQEMNGANEINIDDVADLSDHFLLPLPHAINQEQESLLYANQAEYILRYLVG